MKRIILAGAFLTLAAADGFSQQVFLDNRTKSRLDLLVDGTHKCTAQVQKHDGTKNSGWCQVTVPAGVHTLKARWPNGQTKNYPNITVPKDKIVTLKVE